MSDEAIAATCGGGKADYTLKVGGYGWGLKRTHDSCGMLHPLTWLQYAGVAASGSELTSQL